MARRFRFSLRTLFIFLTVLPCAYFGAWEATKRYGIPAYTAPPGEELVIDAPKIHSIEIRLPKGGILTGIQYVGHASSPAPFVICLTQGMRADKHRYFIWFFGHYHPLFRQDAY